MFWGISFSLTGKLPTTSNNVLPVAGGAALRSVKKHIFRLLVRSYKMVMPHTSVDISIGAKHFSSVQSYKLDKENGNTVYFLDTSWFKEQVPSHNFWTLRDGVYL